MPRYEYTCMNCDEYKEIERKISDEEVFPLCEKCGYKMIRSYKSIGVQFKGPGFYKTDNKK